MRKIGRKNNLKLREYELKVFALVMSNAANTNELLSLINILMSESEKAAIAQRLLIVKDILKGFKYHEIEGLYGTSPNTITKAMDFYFKHGQDNEAFNKIIARTKFPKFNYKENDNEDDYVKPFISPHLPGSIKF